MRQCAVCRHPDRRRIELKRANGGTFETLASQFGLKRDALWRHWNRHVTDETKAGLIAGPLRIAALQERSESESRSLLDYLGVMRTILVDQFCRASEENAYQQTTVLAGRLLEVLREIGKLTGEIQRYTANVTNTTNIAIFNSPDFAMLQSGLIEALADFPDARAAVVRRLRDMERQAAPKLIEGKS